eukprot:gene5326-10650_t
MAERPTLIIIDSIQTMNTASCAGSTGSVTQIRETAAKFVHLAKSTGSVVLLVGHVTKSGEVAGPRVLEHMVDTVLYLEGSERSEHRLLRGVKNRFGSTSEVGVFSMGARGMEDVDNPSELFMSAGVIQEGVEGSAVAIVMEGSRPILAEIQCLVGGFSAAKTPRRASDGFPLPRLQLLCAVIEKRLRLILWNREVYLNVIGGLRISEPAADLATAITIISSLLSAKIKAGSAFVGEIGLGGDLRSGRQMESRILEAQKMGFKRVIVPRTLRKNGKEDSRRNSSGGGGGGIEVIACKDLKEVLEEVLDVPNVDTLLNNHRRRGKKSSPSSSRSNSEAEAGGGGMAYRSSSLDDDGDDSNYVDEYDNDDHAEYYS